MFIVYFVDIRSDRHINLDSQEAPNAFLIDKLKTHTKWEKKILISPIFDSITLIQTINFC